MRRGQYKVEKIIGILKQYEGGQSARELCREYGFSEQTLKRWTAKYRGLEVEDARRLKHLVAELTLDKRALEAALGKRW